MSTAIKWIIGLIIIAGIAWLVWTSGWLAAPTPVPQNNAAATTATTTPQVPANTNGMSASTDTSDAALSQDATAVDTQIQGLQTDTASIDASLSDQPITQ